MNENLINEILVSFSDYFIICSFLFLLSIEIKKEEKKEKKND